MQAKKRFVQVKKRFFFEKKKQKTFESFGPRARQLPVMVRAATPSILGANV